MGRNQHQSYLLGEGKPSKFERSFRFASWFGEEEEDLAVLTLKKDYHRALPEN